VNQNEILVTNGITLQMAIDTTQFGRTFQDRSYVFGIRPRAGSNVPSDANVYNINVRGKRGNILETYPALQYDFVPEILYVNVGDYIHFQWSGCDTNPSGNAGEGTDQTDRSNIVQLATLDSNTPATDAWLAQNTPLFDTLQLRQYMTFINQNASTCLNQTELLAENGDNKGDALTDPRNCMKLNAAPSPYFDGGAIRMNQTTGETTPFFYMCSRNNNFSNRGQKAVIYVLPSGTPLPSTTTVSETTTGSSTGTGSSSTGCSPSTTERVSGGSVLIVTWVVQLLTVLHLLCFCDSLDH